MNRLSADSAATLYRGGLGIQLVLWYALLVVDLGDVKLRTAELEVSVLQQLLIKVCSQRRHVGLNTIKLLVSFLSQDGGSQFQMTFHRDIDNLLSVARLLVFNLIIFVFLIKLILMRK